MSGNLSYAPRIIEGTIGVMVIVVENGHSDLS